MKKEVEKILEEWYPTWDKGGYCMCDKCKDYRIALATSRILKLMESVVPEEKEVSKKYFEHNNNLTHEAKEANALNFGFNICRDEIKGKLNE
jgi:hypothetical protein